MWDANVTDRKIGNYSGDFRKPSDANTGKANDCRVTVPGNWIFNLGKIGDEIDTTQRTFTFWFNVSTLGNGTLMRHANADANAGAYPDYWWEIRVYDAKLQFSHKQNVLRMETEKTLDGLGISAETWHHGAIVYDRSTREASHMFVDGIQVDSLVTSFDSDISAEVDAPPFRFDPVVFGQGDSEFEGMLDEFRIYHRILTPTEVSIIYQTDYKTHAFALEPFPNVSNVIVTTGLKWAPNSSATSQTVYFDDDSDVCTAPIYSLVDTSKDTCSVPNVSIRGDANSLALGTSYYWAVDTNVNGTWYRGPVWKFTAETGKAYDPVPENNEEDVNVGAVNLQWTGTPSAVSYNVYCSDNQSLVADVCDAVLVADVNIHDTNVPFAASIRAEDYYWRVVSTLSAEANKPDVNSDVWTFRTEPYPIVFNTDENDVGYKEQIVPGYQCMVLDPVAGWKTISTGVVDSNCGVIVFEFNDVNYNRRYDIIVLPAYDDSNDNDTNITPLCIDVNGNFYFDGRMNISGDDAFVASDMPMARCGGHRGPAEEEKVSRGNYYEKYDGFNPFLTGGAISNKQYWRPTDPNGHYRYGPGAGGCAPYVVGAGGGYGGIGGNSGRDFYHGTTCLGETYGDKEVPVPFGGSSGGFGKVPGGAGGGGVEIIATGNVTLDGNAVIHADGGDILVSSASDQYPAGGGSGGSVKIIAGGNVTNKGIITVNGGKGGDGSEKANNTGGGGGGGRVAIFHKGTYSNTGTITANGGEKGYIVYGNPPFNDGKSLAQNGQAGTIHDFDSSVSPRKASAPTPTTVGPYIGNHIYLGYNDGNGIPLKWYSGYNVTPANDVVYFGSTPAAMTQLGLPVSATRGQHTSTVNATVVNGQTYCWKVRTVVALPDGNTVDSNVWSFRAVGWQCVEPNDPSADPGIGWDGWPEWDTYPHDCVFNLADLPYFAQYWYEDRGGGTLGSTQLFHEYRIDYHELSVWAQDWLLCRGRTNNGCDVPW
jgi:hypothetical protein